MPTIDTERYNFLVGTLLERGFPVCCVGPVGTGKSSTASNVLRKFNPEKFSILPINMSAQVICLKIQYAQTIISFLTYYESCISENVEYDSHHRSYRHHLTTCKK